MKFRFLALLALVLGLASCQNDFEAGNIVAGGEVDFQLSVDANELATRAGQDGNDTLNGWNSAYGAIDYLKADADALRYDWTDVDLRYSLEVYDVTEDADGNKVVTNFVPVKDRQVIIKDSYEPVVFTLRLVPNRDYRFVVFADFVAQGATANPTVADQANIGLRHTIGNTLQDITVKENNAANMRLNDEVADAYFAFEDIKITNSQAKDMVLRRPYGKLRVVATDLAELNLNVEPNKVKVTYTAANPNKLNAVTGEIQVDNTPVEYVIHYNSKAGKTSMADYTYTEGYDKMTVKNANNETRHTHITLFTDYILADAEQKPINFNMEVFDRKGDIIKANTFNTEIPIQRNYLTTVIGNVLTTATEIDVRIDDNFTNGNTWNPDQDEYDVAAVSTGLEFLKAYYGARNLLLLQDIVVTAADLAAYNDFVANGGGSIFAATRAAQTEETTTTINLNGFTLSFEDDANVEVKEGTTTIVKDDSKSEDGSIEVEEDANNNDKTNGFVVAEGGTLIIESGTIGTGAIENNGTTTIEGGTIESGAIENNGTTNVNNEESVEEDSINNGDEAIVGKYVYTLEELQEAINAAKVGLNNEVSLAADIEGDATILQKDGVNLIINGQGFKYDGTFYIHGGSRYTGAETLKFTNINFEAETAKYFIDSNKTTEKERYAHNVTIENCTFTSLAADNSVAVCGPRFRQAYNITIKECKATNTFFLAWFTGCKNLRIEGCVAENNYEGVTFGPCNNSVIKDSKIDAELFGVRYEPTSDAAYNVTIENCELSGFIPVSVRNIVAGDNKAINVKLVGNNTLTRSEDSLYDVVFAANEYKSGVAPQAPTGEWTIEGADNYVVFPREYKVSDVDQLKKAIAYANTGLNKSIIFVADITGDVTVEQKPDIKVNIDGAKYNYSGVITVDGKSATYTTAGLTIKDINFNAETISADACINLGNGNNATRYTCNVTVDGCTFDVPGAVGVKSYTGGDKNLVITGSTATAKAHSLVQAKGIDGIRVESCEVYSKNGMNFNNSTNVTVDQCTTDVKGYAVRYGESSGGAGAAETYAISKSSLKSACEDGDAVVVLRGTADNSTLRITETTLDGNIKIKNTAKNATIYIDGSKVATANNTDELKAALADKEVATVYLGEGEYVPSLYPGDIPTRESLTIIGAGADKTKFSYTGSNPAGQFSLTGFDSITIRDCEILRREINTWGMIVFGSSNNANGVYTFENCTFNGVGTTGIYINEDVSGATYNILNCTFDGDFGKEGAITIQNNDGVNHILNVKGCTFNNIPETSHKIFVHYAYDGWTLNTDLASEEVYWKAKN